MPDERTPEQRDAAAALEQVVPHQDAPHRTPADASRAGLAALDEHAHPSTHQGSPGHGSGAASTETPGEQHRGGPLPYMKR